MSYWKELVSRSLNFPTILLLLYIIVASLSLEIGNSILLLLTTRPQYSCFSSQPVEEPAAVYVLPLLQNTVICFLFPFTGWLADTVIGRNRAIHISLWLCWLGVFLQVANYLIQYSTCGLPNDLSRYVISSIALLLIMFGSAMALSTIPAYGLDQLIDKPNSSVRSFVHWLTWCLFVGFGISYIHFVKRSSQLPNLLLTTTIVVLIVNSFALVLHGFFNHKFEFSGTLKTNPYKMVYKVVKYAKDHKYPVARSSLTYWEDVPLSRIDFGKAKYGGPFTEDQVEDVKSFGRITFILVSMFGFFIPYYAGFLGVFDFINSFDGAITELYGYASFIPWYLSEQTILIIIPIMEIVIIPLFPKIEYFLSHPLIGIIAMYVLLLISLICLAVITTIGHVISPTHVPCLVVSPTKTVQLSFAYLVVPIFLAGITSGPRFMFMFEFILSQSPSNFSGMLIGAYWLIQAVYINIGSLIQVPFSLGRLDGPGNMPCTFWVLLINVMICFIGMIVFITAAKKYKARQRGDNYNYRAVIESTYERRYQNMLKDESADFETDYEFDIVDDYDPNISQSST